MSILPNEPEVGESTIDFTFEASEVLMWDFIYAEMKVYVQTGENVTYIANGTVFLDG